jgi:hypothetical protein
MDHTHGKTTCLEGAYFGFLHGWLSSNNGGTSWHAYIGSIIVDGEVCWKWIS